MSHSVTIGIATAKTKLDIQATPTAVIPPVASGFSSYSFTPNPTNEVLIDPTQQQFSYNQTATAEAPIGGIQFQQSVIVEVGTQTNSLVPQLLNAFQYEFPNFTQANIASDFEYGDLCYITSGSNEYNSALKKADVTDTAKGAYNNLFIYKGYISNTLYLIHKGYFEVPSTKINAWNPGRTIYLNGSNKLDIIPTIGMGNWVRSLGFCLPNNEDKKFIWFEPDSTYLKLN